MNFFKNKRVFVTGHSGFKGSWLCMMLTMAGAQVTGFSLPPEGDPNLFTLSDVGANMVSKFGDIRDFDKLKAAFDEARPEIVIHLAAQPIVRTGYQDPMGTYHTNVMGSVHILECVRQSDYVRSFLNVTTDKVYQNQRWVWGYRENDPLNGYDPYANSKSCSELVTESYRKSFFPSGGTAISTARAGNVIGGGDFAVDRIIPDCIRAAIKGTPIPIRNPDSTRPYQHVLDPLSAYLLIVRRQYEDQSLAGCYNVGPDSRDCVTTGTLADLFCKQWSGASWEHVAQDGPHEDTMLKLDSTKIQSVLGWRPSWHIEEAVARTVSWTVEWLGGNAPSRCMERQIRDFYQGKH